MSRLRKSLLAILIGFVAIQFVQPARNANGQVLATDITKTLRVTDSVQIILKTACYDCHSNNTNYPYYAYIQPIGWLLNNHIQEGKKQLNFSDFGSMTKRRQESKLKSIVSQVKDDAMPLPAYIKLHKNAVLTKEAKEILINWAITAKDTLSSQ
jgi:Haem-binding domain